MNPEREWLFWKSDDLLNVKINNRSDMDLENVRVFLCIHYTDMYKDEYDVVKVPKTMNIIPKHSTADLDTLRITYPGKTYEDITRIRAIAVTDDRICWVDDVDYKQNHVLDVLRGIVKERGIACVTSSLISKYLIILLNNPKRMAFKSSNVPPTLAPFLVALRSA